MIQQHRPALEYDWRARFHLPLTVVGASMSWGEAIRLTRLLRADSSSQTAAAIEGWDYPISHEALAILDLFDLEHQVNSKKRPKPHPLRPWKSTGNAKQMGKVGDLSPERVREILAAARDGSAPV